MEKGTGDSPPETSASSSPRSTLRWKDVWGSERTIADLEPTKYKPLVRDASHTRSKSVIGVSSSVTPDGPKTRSLQLETPTRCKSFVGLPSRGTPDGPKTPPLQLERRFRRLSLPLDADRRECGELRISESTVGTDGSATNSRLTPISGAVQLAANERVRGAQRSQLWEPVWLHDFPTDVFPPALSRASSSAQDDGTFSSSAGEDMWSVGSSDSSVPRARGQKAAPSNRMEIVSSLSEELVSIKSSMKRAIDLGKQVQRHGALEVSQLRGEKANAEAAIRKAVLLSHDLEQQVTTLRDEVQKLQWERELEVRSMNNEIRELKMERNNLRKTVQEEKNKREKLQIEVDSVLSVLLEEKMKLESERDAHDIAVRNEKKKLQAMRKSRDAAVKTLEEGNRKLDVERDAMLLAMRDLTSRLDFERDAKLRTMRRTSMEMATMMSGSRSSGSRRQSFGFNDDQSPRSQSISRHNSKQYEQFVIPS